uniref:hypothetical protein n=1 Tax=Desulfuromonas thiophila TaxID=57664 RepID=UPI0024A8F147
DADGQFFQGGHGGFSFVLWKRVAMIAEMLLDFRADFRARATAVSTPLPVYRKRSDNRRAASAPLP